MTDGSDFEILNWLDDHSRYLLYCAAHHRVTGPDVVASFTTIAAEFGPPASTLTDNGAVYTSRFTHGHNDFERLLASLGITHKNGHPGHPQTQGKIERFHQTLKHWLTPRPRPTTLADAQTCSMTSASFTTPPGPNAPYPTTAHPRRPPRHRNHPRPPQC